MRISLQWLSDFVDLPDLEVLLETLANAGVDVESVFNPAASICGVVVAHVQKVEAHPQAQRLRVCDVFDGKSLVHVVCGASNVAPGQRVAYAGVGAVLPGGIRLEAKTFRGVRSMGMLCSRADLGLEDSSPGIWELPWDVPIGGDIRTEIPFPVVLDLGITPNRPDLLSHRGLAREVAAFTGQRLKASSWRLYEKGPRIGTLARLVVEDPLGCRRYVARVVRNVRVGPSPAWLKDRLESMGQRSINNVVDATHYAMYELGLPLHAFDLAHMAGALGYPTVHVRSAAPGECLRTLDGVERKLSPADMVIADAHRPIALAGVMGGANTEVSQATVNIFLEAACFDPLRIRQSSQRHGLRTEASYRFERGMDPAATSKAVERCAQLLTEVAGGEVAKGVLEWVPKVDKTQEIALRLERIPRLLGTSVSAEEVVHLLEPLDIRCTARTEAALVFQTPSFRADLQSEVDLIEEVARRYGYGHLPERLPNSSAAYCYEPWVHPWQERIRVTLLSQGCTEVITYAFADPDRFEPWHTREGKPLRLLNPLGEDFSALRTTLIPGLLQVLKHNQRHGCKHVRIFEIGSTFHPCAPRLKGPVYDRNLPCEDQRLAVALWGGRASGRWYEQGAQVDFSDLAGLVEQVVLLGPATQAMGLGQQGGPPSYVHKRPTVLPGFNPYASAELWVDGMGDGPVMGPLSVGVAGQVDPRLLQKWDLAGPVYVAELSLDTWTQLSGTQLSGTSVVYRPLPKFPSTRRDVAVIAPQTLASEQIRSFIESHAGGTLGPHVVERVWLFDVYKGNPMAASHVSLAFAIEYRGQDRTLTDTEVGQAFQNMICALEQEFDVDVRHPDIF